MDHSFFARRLSPQMNYVCSSRTIPAKGSVIGPNGLAPANLAAFELPVVACIDVMFDEYNKRYDYKTERECGANIVAWHTMRMHARMGDGVPSFLA